MSLVSMHKELRHRLYKEIPGLKAILEKRRGIKAAVLIRNWVSAKAAYPQRELLILHWEHSVPKVLDLLDTDAGGLWCGGAAFLLAFALNACYIPSSIYSYGVGDISHETVVLGQTLNAGKNYQYYILDAYLNFHYIFPGTNTWMPISELWQRVRNKRYQDIQRVDSRIERNLVTSTRDAAYYKWLFDYGVPEIGHKIANGNTVYAGATHSVQKVLAAGPFRDGIDAVREGQPIDEFMLDLMMVNPAFGVMTPNAEAYPETSLLRTIIDSLVDLPEWAKELI